MHEKQILLLCKSILEIVKLYPQLSQAQKASLNKITFKVNPRLTSVVGRATISGSDFGLIEISLPVAERNNLMGDLVDTILHEIAHILEPDAGHGLAWKLIARKIGCTAERLAAPNIKKGLNASQKAKKESEALKSDLIDLL